jgi:hypothetical protein
MQDLDRLARMYTPRMRQKVAAAGSPLIDEGCNCCDRDCISFLSGVEGLGVIIRTDGATEWKYVFQRPISRTRHLRELQCD